MAVKIRLARRGRRKQPYYHIIVADARSPRDGKFIEQIGSYNPMSKPATIDLDIDKAYDWIMKGAQPTETARAILRFKGVLYKKHLQRGVDKGALTQEAADELLAKHVEGKEVKVAERFEQSKKERLQFLKQVSGSPKKKYVEEVAATEALKEFQEVEKAADVQESAEPSVVGATQESPEAKVSEDVQESAEPTVSEDAQESSEPTVSEDAQESSEPKGTEDVMESPEPVVKDEAASEEE